MTYQEEQYTDKFVIAHKVPEPGKYGSWSVRYVGSDTDPITSLDVAAMLTTILDMAVSKVPESIQNEMEAEIMRLFAELAADRHEFMEIKTAE